MSKVIGSIFRMPFATSLLASAVFACTAVKGMDPIGDSNRTAWTFGLVSALIVLVSVAFYFLRKRKGRWVVITSAILFAIHPAWTVTAWGGDCGLAKVDYSQWFTGFLTLLAIYQALRWIIQSRRPSESKI